MFKEANGKLSLLRIIVFAICVFGLAGGVASFVLMFMNHPSALGALGICAGLLSIGEVAKVWQKSSEQSSGQ